MSLRNRIEAGQAGLFINQDPGDPSSEIQYQTLDL